MDNEVRLDADGRFGVRAFSGFGPGPAVVRFGVHIFGTADTLPFETRGGMLRPEHDRRSDTVRVTLVVP